MRVMITHLSGSRKGDRELFDEPRLTIGRARKNAVRLGLYDTRASSNHAELLFEGGQFTLTDLNSTNGTYVNGKRVTKSRLRSGDVVSLGFGGPQLQFEFFEKLSTARPSIEETHEFAFRSRYKGYLWAGACFFFGVTIAALYFDIILVAIPAALTTAALFFLGVASARINITVGPDGIKMEGMLRTRRIHWEDVKALESTRGRTTTLLRGTICRVRGRRRTITFSPADYEEGYMLARLIAEASAKVWHAPSDTGKAS